MCIGENIAKIAEKKGMTIYKVAQASNISNSYLSELISNKKNNPSIGVMIKIANVLNVTVDEIITGDEANE